ncbi:MAG: SEC-C metal-binding domain-containing protein [bacterium]|nr:SEC-C metal-binding domain-containing protein [bacterium]
MMTLAQVLNTYKKDELQCYARELGVQGYSGLNKYDLAVLIASFLLEPEVMSARFSTFSDTAISVFERALTETVYIDDLNDLEFDEFCFMNEHDYVYHDRADGMEIADDVKMAYKRINTPDFHVRRQKTVWMLECLNLCETIYGITPLDVLLQIYNSRPGFETTKTMLKSLIVMTPWDMISSHFDGDFLVYDELREGNAFQHLSRVQNGKEFYIPTYQEVLEYEERFYLASEPSYKKLCDFMLKRMHLTEEDAEDETCGLWNEIAGDCDVNEELQNMLGRIGDHLRKEDLQKLLDLVMECHNHTRMQVHRGHTPVEMAGTSGEMRRFAKNPVVVPGSTLAAEMLKQSQDELTRMGIKVDYDSNAGTIPVLGFPSGLDGAAISATRKVYPNDPCPCGSGKKYKKCCGQ